MLLLFVYARTIYKQISEIPKTETLVQQWPLTSLRSFNWSSSVKHTKKFSTEFHPQKESKSRHTYLKQFVTAKDNSGVEHSRQPTSCCLKAEYSFRNICNKTALNQERCNFKIVKSLADFREMRSRKAELCSMLSLLDDPNNRIVDRVPLSVWMYVRFFE